MECETLSQGYRSSLGPPFSGRIIIANAFQDGSFLMVAKISRTTVAIS
jgi:hypothetical protein